MNTIKTTCYIGIFSKKKNKIPRVPIAWMKAMITAPHSWMVFTDSHFGFFLYTFYFFFYNFHDIYFFLVLEWYSQSNTVSFHWLVDINQRIVWTTLWHFAVMWKQYQTVAKNDSREGIGGPRLPTYGFLDNVTTVLFYFYIFDFLYLQFFPIIDVYRIKNI